MTFTKEQLQDALDNMAMGYMSCKIDNVPDSPCLIFAHQHQADVVAEAATLLQKYIAALDMAERDLIMLMKDLKNEIYGSPAQTQSEEHVTKYVNDRYGKALTTIRQMKGGE